MGRELIRLTLPQGDPAQTDGREIVQMVAARVHYEVFGCRRRGSPWTLETATEDRAAALRMAEDMIADGFSAAKVTKETLDEDTRAFASLVILQLGAVEAGKRVREREDLEPLCVQPQDLYTVHARERIGQLLQGWLERNKVTPFELLHRPDLVERLEASGGDLQHAVQKIAVPEAQERGMTVHELIRNFHGLIERAIARLLKDHRRGALVDLSRESFGAAAQRLQNEGDGGYYLGAGVAGLLAQAESWSDKIRLLLDLADGAPEGPAGKFALAVLEQPLAEILGAKPGLGDLIGANLDLGAELAAMTRLAAGDAVDMLIRIEPSVAKVMPPLEPTAQRLCRWIGGEGFEQVRMALGKRILREISGPRRLRPEDATGEIEILRGLAMSLTAAAGKLLPLNEVQAAFSTRSRALVAGDFVEAYLGRDRTPFEEAQAMVWLTENVIGATNKRHASRWLAGVVSALRFENDVCRSDGESPAARLAKLADLQRQVGRCGLAPEDAVDVQAKLGELGGQIEAEAKLVANLARAAASPVNRLAALLRLASGESAPLGPAADRARSEALKLAKDPDTRAQLAAAPEQLESMRGLFQQAGLAA
jgi:hypothetical protein